MMIASSVWAEAPVIGNDSEWKATMETIRKIQQECVKKQASDVGQCFVDLNEARGEKG
jgi:hypothetical protein